jgi:integrase
VALCSEIALIADKNIGGKGGRRLWQNLGKRVAAQEKSQNWRPALPESNDHEHVNDHVFRQRPVVVDNKERVCPLWPSTVAELKALIANRGAAERVFLNRCHRPITRYGIHTMVERHTLKASAQMPSLKTKQVSPHTIRHTTAMHLLRAGVDINTIRAWLGHVSIETTNIYAEIDLEMKAKALAHCEVPDARKFTRPWRDDPKLMEFLRSL